MTRKEYMDSSFPRNNAHREYYAQYVTESIRLLVKSRIGLSRLQKSTDEHLNDIPLDEWDRLAPIINRSANSLLRANGDFPTLNSSICIAKEAARQILESSEVQS